MIPRLEHFDIQPALSAFDTAQAGLVEDKKRQTLSDIGGQMANGDLSGAASAALRSGNLDAGMKIQGMQDDRQTQALTIMAKMAQHADTPEKWNEYTNYIHKRIPDANLPGFDQRDAVLAEFAQAVEAKVVPPGGSVVDMNNPGAGALYTAPAAPTSANRPPPGYRWTPDGNLEPIPGGPASGGKTANAPPGYKWANDGSTLEPIPGGPATKVPAELAARLGLAKNFLKQLDGVPAMKDGKPVLDAAGKPTWDMPPLKDDIKNGSATGLLDWATAQTGRGRAGQIYRRIESGTDALRRMLTGAGMPAAEAADYVRRYQPTIKDDAATLVDKVTQLEVELKSMVDEAGRGRTAAPDPTDPNAMNATEAITGDQGDAVEGDVAVGPNGEQIILRGGQWEPL